MEAIARGERVLETFKLVLEPNIELEARIVDVGDYVYHYEIKLPEVDFLTEAIIDDVKRSLVGELELGRYEVVSPERSKVLKEKFFASAREKLKAMLSDASGTEVDLLSRKVANEMVGLGDLEYLLADPNVEEVVVNSSKECVWIYHKFYGWLKTNVQLASEELIRNYASRVARDVGRELTHLEPLLDAHLPTGDRLNATLFPISTHGNTITIRRFSRVPWTMIHLIDPRFNTISPEAAAFLWMAVEYELSILLSGGTASGKTAMLNALLAFMPANQRIITIEDTRELSLPDFLHWIPLTTRPAGPRGEGEVSLLDLIENALRMRPDRIVVGEVRRKRETEVLFEAMHTGHSVYGTFHANRASEVVERITGPPMNIPPIVLGSLPLIVVQHLNRRTGQRRTFEVVELIRKEEVPELNILYKWNPRTDRVEKVNESKRVYEELELYTGFTKEEVNEDLSDRKLVLEWLLRREVRDINRVGRVVTEYYIDRDRVIDAALRDGSPLEILGE